MGEAWIIDVVRTPRGKGRKDVGALVHTHPQELMATTLRALAARNGIDPDVRALHPMVTQGISADLIATLEGLTRQQLDTFAAASQARAAAALQAGRFACSVVPVQDKEGKSVLDHDEYPRHGTTVETL